MKKAWIGKGTLAVAVMALAGFLLGKDSISFYSWWMLAGILGLLFQPLTARLFSGFADRGWMFSKVIGVLIPGYLTWVLVVGGILPFTTASCIGVTAVCAVLLIVWCFQDAKKRILTLPEGQWNLVYWEELIFLVMFLLWTYLAGFRPQAYGTEKFMDYGFMEAMMRSVTLPAKDLWYSLENINYYYGGQYFAVFLTKLTGTQVAVTYNLMRTFEAGLMFALPCSLVWQLLRDRMGKSLVGKKKSIPVLGGLLTGVAVSMAGNMHYVIYAWIWPRLADLGIVSERDDYWFPDATRYIGHDPETADKTIHEFPSYSFVLGDLHAHMVNLIFVILILGILYAWMRQKRKQDRETFRQFGKSQVVAELLQPGILAAAVLLGVYQWTNYWDFVIYYVVTGAVVLFTNIIVYEGRVRRIAAVTFLQAVEVMAVAMVVALPFTLTFDSMTQGVALAQNHSAFYQLCILWGLPVVLVLIYGVTLLWEKVRSRRWAFLEGIRTPDLYILILGLCAVGLILIPELVYVRDIYENGNARSNTMFKLTYQAYLMFGISMGYILFWLLAVCRKRWKKVAGAVGLSLLLMTSGYFGNAVRHWYGEVWRPSLYQGLDATSFLEVDFPADAAAIRWLRENIQGSPVVLEANGLSYTEYERVSAMTGLPTILGWYTHEQLWRGNNVEDLNEKSAEVQEIYTSTDEQRVRSLLEKYDVSYIFVGSTEWDKYGSSLNEDLLQSLGTVVFQDEIYGTYILQVE